MLQCDIEVVLSLVRNTGRWHGHGVQNESSDASMIKYCFQEPKGNMSFLGEGSLPFREAIAYDVLCLNVERVYHCTLQNLERLWIMPN